MIISFTIWCLSQLSLSKDIICVILYYGGKYTDLVRRKITHSHPRTPGLGVFLIAQPCIGNAHYQQKFKSCVVVWNVYFSFAISQKKLLLRAGSQRENITEEG